MHVVSVPGSDWIETVLQMMDLATVIVVDVNAGRNHWMLDLPYRMDFIDCEGEIHSRVGMVTEIEHILSRGFDYKTVVLAPPGWLEMMTEGQIADQIRREEELALDHQIMILGAKGQLLTTTPMKDVRWFARTRLKRAVSRITRVEITESDVISHIQGILRESGKTQLPRT